MNGGTNEIRYIGPKPTKACVNCRRQKMKCEAERGAACRRCRLNKIECVFKPRANAAAVIEVVDNGSSLLPGQRETTRSEAEAESVQRRLAKIESILNIQTLPEIVPELEEEADNDPSLDGLWEATANLKRFTGPMNTKIWSKGIVKQLWVSFYANMEGLHFQSEREASENPTPLLLASILYVSALHHGSDELAGLAPKYFRAVCSAIAELSIPAALKTSELAVRVSGRKSIATSEQVAFQNVLGLILAGLISEAFIDLTGIWISIGYRLTLDHCPVYIDETSSKWRQLFSGLRIIDLEHASLHLSCPVIPLKAPLPSLRQLQSFTEDPFNRLTEIMHVGLSHFAGRGLPSLLSFISSNESESRQLPLFPFTDNDAKVIGEWAKQLDDWLVSSNKPNNSDGDRKQIMRQYSLHRLFVLSIYHPARGFDLFANDVASIERHELLLSARATLRLQNNDKGIWANWDLVIITWAAILVLQAAEGGVGESGDLMLVQSHLNMLQRTHQPAPSLNHTLAQRLETWLQSMSTPPAVDPDLPQLEFDPSWSLFDENSMKIAAETVYQPLNMQNTTLSDGANFSDPQPTDLAIANYNNTGSWSNYEQISEVWPANLIRLFGSAEFQASSNTQPDTAPDVG